jgi:transcriptional regulator with GAF, ATPase, and Fis domain
MLDEAERTQILRALELADGIVSEAATRLKIPRSTLMSRMQRLGIRGSRNYVACVNPKQLASAASA